MTMTRTEKASHQDMILGADTADLVDAIFASPTLIRQRGGRRRMTRSEYIVHRMSRGFQNADMARDLYDSARRYRRRPVRR